MSATSPPQTPREAKPRDFQPGNQAAVGHGAPKGNSNALRAGLKSQIVRNVTLGAFCDEAVRKQLQRFRRIAEDWCLEAHGVISPTHELALNTATRNEAVALLATKWLKRHHDTMSHDERLKYVEAVAKASERRDKAIDRLKLDVAPQDLVSQLYAPILPPADEGTE